MKRSTLLFGCLALLVLPSVAWALAVPVTVTLDMPNQALSAPTSGITNLIFTGTVSLAQGWQSGGATVENPFNNSKSSFLSANIDPAFLAWNGFGSFTGNLFDVTVPAGTPPDFYGYGFLSNNPPNFTESAFLASQPQGNAPSINGNFVSAMAPFTVLVNAPATGVPEQGSTLLLMGASLAALVVGRWLVRPVLRGI